MSNAGSRVEVVLEVVPKRSFASALDWPGWCRSGSTPDAALEALATYADRYATVAAMAGMRLPTVRSIDSLTVVEEIEGDATTGFGAPSKAATAESRPTAAKEADRAAIRAMRGELLAVIRADRTGQPARENGWPPRYCARRLAWHALDHAWEMRDRSTP